MDFIRALSIFQGEIRYRYRVIVAMSAQKKRKTTVTKTCIWTLLYLIGFDFGVCGQIKGDKWHLPHRVTPVPCKGLHTHIHVHHTLHTSAMGSREETDSLLNGRSSMDLRRRCARQALICLPLGSEVGPGWLRIPGVAHSKQVKCVKQGFSSVLDTSFMHSLTA